MRGKRTNRPGFSSITLSLALSHRGRGENRAAGKPCAKIEPDTIEPLLDEGGQGSALLRQ